MKSPTRDQFRRTRAGIAMLALTIVLLATTGHAAEWGLKEGTPDLKSAGSLAFGPEGILFVGDSKGSALFAIETGDTQGEPAKAKFNITGLNTRVAEALAASPADIQINDLVVNPLSGNLYLSLANAGKPALVRIDAAGKLTPLGLQKVKFLKATLPNPPEDKVVGEGARQRNLRDDAITDLAYIDGKVIVSGMTSGASPSTVRELAFPFAAADQGINVEIYHAAHGKIENNATVRVFVPFAIGNEMHLLAGFTCTPLVKFPIEKFEAGKTVRGTTVAELGNRNKPLDMIVYKKGEESFLLLTNNNRGVMKVSTNNIDRAEGITEPVTGGGTAGQAYDTIKELTNVVQLDRLNDESAVILVQSDAGAVDLKTIALP